MPNEQRITRADYDQLLTAPLLNTATPTQTLTYLGTLIDTAHAFRDATGAQHALTISEQLDTTTWTSSERATLHFFLANAHDDLRNRQKTTRAQRWEWTSQDFDASLLHLRQAVNEPDFPHLTADTQCKILTNLGNKFSTIGRYIEAQEHWNHALRINPTFPMALANRGYGRTIYAKTLHDPGHRHAFIRHAYEDLLAGIPTIPYPDAKAFFTAEKAELERVFTNDVLAPHPFRTFGLGDTNDEITYRTWALQHRLFLNPINDLTTQAVAAHDVIHTPNMIVPRGEPPIYQGFFNQLKQEYTTARFLLYQGLHQHAPPWADKEVRLYNTLDYPAYGTNLELIKLAFRSSYSLFDKIAYLLNHYLTLGISEKRVNFKTLWYENENPKKSLKPTFDSYANLPLRGLYWISRDLDENTPRHLSPDAAALGTIRQHLEHKYLSTHPDSDP